MNINPRVILLLCLFSTIEGIAQNNTPVDTSQSLYHYLYDLEKRPTITIDTDFGKVVRNSRTEEYQPGKISISVAEDTLHHLNMQIRARGNIRKEVCYLPPLKINLIKSELSEIGFSKDDKIKLLLPCDFEHEQYSFLFKEHFLYQIYNQIDTNALRSRIVNVVQKHKGKIRNSFTGLLLEDEGAYATRKKAKFVESGRLVYTVLERSSFLKMLFFQYMIGNTDWDVEHRHNLEMVKIEGVERIIPIPYDFDYSGFVNQSYAVPSNKLSLRNVKERHFFGYPVSDEEFSEMVVFFKAHKPKVVQLFQSANYFNEYDKEGGLEYLNGFFDALDDPETLKQKMLGKKRNK